MQKTPKGNIEFNNIVLQNTLLSPSNCDDIEIIEAIIYDSDGKELGNGSWPCSDETKILPNVPAGSDRNLIVQGKNKDLRVLFYCEEVIDVIDDQVVYPIITTERFEADPISPLSSASVPNDALNFEWNSVPGAANYHLQLSADSNFNSLSIDKTIQDISYKPETSLEPGSYYWRVSPLTRSQESGLFSSIQSFEIYIYVPPIPRQAAWVGSYGGSYDDQGYHVEQTSDGGFIAIGETFLEGADSDYYILKTDADGGIQWERRFGGEYRDEGFCIIQAADDRYVAIGTTYATFDSYLWLLVLDADGRKVDERKYFDTNSAAEAAASIQQTSDGGYIIVGYTRDTTDGDLNALILKLDANFDEEVSKSYGGTGSEFATAIKQTDDGGYIVSGCTTSKGAGDGDIWILKVDDQLNLEWDNTYGGSDTELYLTDIVLALDGGYMVIGGSNSFNIDNLYDIWVFKVDTLGNLIWDETYGAGSDEIYSLSIAYGINNDGYILGGYTSTASSTLIKIDGTGKFQWKGNYLGTAICVRTATFPGNGGYLFAGSIDDTDNGKNLLLILTDENGNTPDAPDRP